MILNKSIPSVLSRKFGTKFFLVVSTVLSLSSCDESSVVGLDVQPANDLLGVGWEDTTTIRTRTVKGDSLITDETLISTGEVLIGKYRDPVFGNVIGSLYTQVRLPVVILPTSFGTSPVCDSVVIQLMYNGVCYGKKERKMQKVQVFQMTEPMSTGTVLFSDRTFATSPIELTDSIGGHSFIPRPTDSVENGITDLRPHLRIPLNNAFGQLILNNQTTGNLSLNSIFQSNLLNGIYITTENTPDGAPGDGNIMHFLSGISKLTVYYHNADTTGLAFDFSLGSVARVNHYVHDYSNADPNLQLQVGASGASQNPTCYLGGMAGTRTKILLPYLNRWTDSGAIAVNKAELVIKVDTSSAAYMKDTFNIPNNLMLFGINDSGQPYAIPDAFEGSNYFGGAATGGLEYKFNIARYVQQVLNGERNNNGLYLIVSNGAIFANRVVIGGGDPASSKQMKLNITYTKLHH